MLLWGLFMVDLRFFLYYMFFQDYLQYEKQQKEGEAEKQKGR